MNFWSAVANPLQLTPQSWTASFKNVQAPSVGLNQSQNPDNAPANRIQNSFSLSYDELVSQAANRTRGFQIFDIDPKALDRATYPCTMPAEYLGELFGFENSTSTNVGVTPPTLYVNDDGLADYVQTYYRTIAISVVGNFLQMEYPGLASNDMNSTRTKADGSQFFAPRLKSYDEVVPAPSPTLAPPNNIDLLAPNSSGFLSHEHVSKEIMLLQFEDGNQKPHVLKSGMTFDGYFTQLLITVKIGGPKVRLCVGFNSRKSDSVHQTITNTQLHLAGSKNFVEKLNSPLIPFVLSSYNFNITTAPGFLFQKLIQHDLVDTVSGYGLVFLTELSFTANAPSATSQAYKVQLSAESGLASKTIYETVVSGNSSWVSGTFNFSVPIRASVFGVTNLSALAAGNLGISVTRLDSSTSYNIYFSVKGYSFGKIYQNSAFGAYQPFLFSKKLLDNQFINEFDFEGVS